LANNHSLDQEHRSLDVWAVVWHWCRSMRAFCWGFS